MSEPSTLLDVRDLRVRFRTNNGIFDAVRGISFQMGREKLGIVGESGSGKSLTGRSILRLTPPSATVTAQRLEFDGVDILTARQKTLREIRGKRVSLVMQDPKFSLNPVMTIGKQIGEAYRSHGKADEFTARERALEMLSAVRIRDPERVYRSYPHELSGGMGQRVMIAMMLVPDPDLLIADEPTSALDVTVQMQVLAIIDDLVSQRGMGLIFISHDLNLVASFCDRVLIMYGGQIVESLPAAQLSQAQHPYTKALLSCLPSIEGGNTDLPSMTRDPRWLEPLS